MALSSVTISKFPEEYLTLLDKVLTQNSFTKSYTVHDAVFLGAKTVQIPSIDFTGADLKDYNAFSTTTPAKLKYEAITLPYDKESVFKVDAVDDMDTAHLLTTNLVSEFERNILVPTIDKQFFDAAKTAAKTTGTATLTSKNIITEIRKARAQFLDAGLVGGDLFMSYDALAALEDAINRQFAGEGAINDTVGKYDGFDIYAVPKARMDADFIAIAGGTNTIRHVVKRAAEYFFAPGQHSQGDCFLMQNRWVYGDVIPENKKVGIYANKKG